MSRLTDLAGVLRGLQKVSRALNAQQERTAGDAWLQSSIREGVERALSNKPSPEQLGKNVKYIHWGIILSCLLIYHCTDWYDVLCFQIIS